MPSPRLCAGPKMLHVRTLRAHRRRGVAGTRRQSGRPVRRGRPRAVLHPGRQSGRGPAPRNAPRCRRRAQSEELLHDWLAELLYIFEVRRLALARFQVNIGPDGLTATVQGEPIDTARHQLDMEVKAITWHGLKVVRDGGGRTAAARQGRLVGRGDRGHLMAAVPVKRVACPAIGRHGLTVGHRCVILVPRGLFAFLFSKSGEMPKLQVVRKQQLGQVAQLVEHWTENPGVAGSIPALSTSS